MKIIKSNMPKSLLNTTFLKYLTAKGIVKNKTRGIAAVEFAMVAPVMLLLLFGSTEITQAVVIDRKVTLAASTIADLVTQGSKLDCPTFKTAVAITREVFAPYDNQGDNAEISIASVYLDNETPKIEWSRTIDSSGNCVEATKYPAGATVNITGTTSSGVSTNLVKSMLNSTNAIIIGDVDLKYTSLGTSFFPSNLKMSERFFYRPRKSDKVCYEGINTSGCE